MDIHSFFISITLFIFRYSYNLNFLFLIIIKVGKWDSSKKINNRNYSVFLDTLLFGMFSGKIKY